MKAARAQRTKALFEQLLELPAQERDAFLKEACGSDRALEEDVRSLLAAHEEVHGFLEDGQVARALVDLSSADDPLLGAVIGDYRLVGLLGRGGMGAVYRAEQEHPHREVALKLIDRSLVTPELLRRFEIEAEVLARLKHTGIAQIHVTGTTGVELGARPYFAMELVDGLPLTTFADERDLDLRERLELLIRVCEAVQHAHQVGVIHRDLKPANILVTAEGQPKVLDFGIARSTDADLQVTTVTSGQARLMGTLPYMSPEQVRGDPDELDTRSDVHALGVMAYELLTGELPRDLEGKSLTDAIRTIVGEEPRTLRAAGARRFPADLETIVAKALESDRHRRYDSASGLAADLRHFLDGQPISARPPSAFYQLRKLVLRNRLPAALVAGLVVLTVASAVFMAIQVRRTARERDRAGLEAQTATEVSTFLESLFLEADPEQSLGDTLTARELLDRGVERMGLELEEQPVVRGRLLTILGKVYESLGQRDRATPMLEEAVEIGRALQGERDEAEDPSNLVTALCLLARCHGFEGQTEEAIALCREALALSEAAYGAESASSATCLNHLAYHLAIGSQFDEARTRLEAALELRERLLGPEHLDTGWSVYQYAHLLRITGEQQRARAQFERALAIWGASLAANHPQLASCHLDYAALLGDLGEFDAALEHAVTALEIREEVLGPDHPAIADALNNLGYLNWQRGNLPEALGYFTDAVEAHKRASGPADPGIFDRLQNVVRVGDALDRMDVVEDTYLEGLSLAGEHHAEEPAILATAIARLAFFYASAGRGGEAKPLLREAATHFELAGESWLDSWMTMQRRLASILDLVEEPEELLRVERELLAAQREHPELQKTPPLFTRWSIGLALVSLGRLEEAESHLRELLSDAESAFDVNAFFPWNVRWFLGHCRHGLGFEDEARALYQAVLSVDPGDLGEDRFWLHLRTAEDHAAAGRMDVARRELRSALEAGLSPAAGRDALRLNPHLGPGERAELLVELGAR